MGRASLSGHPRRATARQSSPRRSTIPVPRRTLARAIASLLFLTACGSRGLRNDEGADGGDARVDGATAPVADVGAAVNDAGSRPDLATHIDAVADTVPAADASDDTMDATATDAADAGPPALGSPYRVLSVAVGRYHTCALLDDHGVKCWGYNTYGQLGLGDTRERGASVEEMGDALPKVDLGAGRTAKAISAARYATCALLDDDSVKCWGWKGQIGPVPQDATYPLGSVGDEPGEMGDALPAVALGAGPKAKRIVMGYYTACAVLDDDSMRCWSESTFETREPLAGPRRIVAYAASTGVLVLLDDGSVFSIGGSPALVVATPLKTIGASRSAACGVLVEGGVICNPSYRKLNEPDPVELAMTEFGDLCGRRRDGRVTCAAGVHPWLDTVNPDDGTLVALGQPAVSLVGSGSDHLCAVLADGSLKCWSWNRGTDFSALGASISGGSYQTGWRAIDLGTHQAR